MALTLKDANRMVEAVISKAGELNVKISVAVCDAGGHLLAFNRMEGCIWASATVAQGKAVTAAGFGMPSGALPADNPVLPGILQMLGGRMVLAQGGLPISQDGLPAGSIGASGATAEQDEQCAKAGLDVL